MENAKLSFMERRAPALFGREDGAGTRPHLIACAFAYNAHATESSKLHSNTSRAFAKPTSGRIAVKVINHLGDEVMKVFKVPGQ